MNRNRLTVAAACLVGALALPTAHAEDPAPAPEAQATEEESAWWGLAVALYEQAKAAGENVPGDVKEWFAEDMSKIGTWEYMVITVEGGAEVLETELNRLGAERWECLWIEGQGRSRRLVLKRPTRSYMGSIRWMDLIKLIGAGQLVGDGS